MSFEQPNRRRFLATSSLALAGLTLGARTLPASIVRSKFTGADLLPEPIQDSLWKQLASKAVDAAKSAGATYADIRIGDRHNLSMGMRSGSVVGGPSQSPGISVSTDFGYGVRVLVDGVWGFTYGNVPTADAVTRAVQNAIATAKGFSGGGLKQTSDFIPIKAESGEWAGPMDIDPFSVPLDEQTQVMGGFAAQALRVYNVEIVDTGLDWTRETRVFASTEGAMQVQRFMRADPSVSISASDKVGAGLGVADLRPLSIGYETVLRPELHQRVYDTAKEAVRLAGYPRKGFDIGKYELVLDGQSVACVLGSTLSPALELDRALGYEADAAGTSFLPPTAEVLGQPLFSPKLTITGDHKMPDYTAVKWDDDGVAPTEYTIIKEGKVVDYHTNRQTVPSLASWYAQQKQQVASNGCGVAGQSDRPPLVGPGHLAMSPAASAKSVEELCKSVQKGVLVYNVPWVSSDQQLSSGSAMQGMFYVVEKGQILGQIRPYTLYFQFRTAPLWKAMNEVGGPETVDHFTSRTYKGQPWQQRRQTVSAPAAYFKEVNIMEFPRARGR